MIIPLLLALGAATAALVAIIVRRRSLNAAVDNAVELVGYRRDSREPRPEALATAMAELETRLAQAKRERSQLVGALEKADVGVMAIGDGGEVSFANKVAEELLGARQGERLEHPDANRLVDRVVVGRNPESADLDVHAPVRRVLNLSAKPLEHGVESIGAVVFVTDVTGQRRVDAVRRDFVTNVGRELRAPIGGLATLAKTMAVTEDADVRRNLRDTVVAEADRLSDLVDDLLDLAQVEAFAAVSEPIAIGEAVAEASARVAQEADARGVSVLLEPVPEGAYVAGDRQQLVTALSHLLDNAVRFTAAKADDPFGKVNTRVAIEEEWIAVEVRDQGVGMPPEELDRIFERFYRVRGVAQSATPGSGVGLALVRHVVLNHGGEVSVTSEEGKGSTFTVRLPHFAG